MFSRCEGSGYRSGTSGRRWTFAVDVRHRRTAVVADAVRPPGLVRGITRALESLAGVAASVSRSRSSHPKNAAHGQRFVRVLKRDAVERVAVNGLVERESVCGVGGAEHGRADEGTACGATASRRRERNRGRQVRQGSRPADGHRQIVPGEGEIQIVCVVVGVRRGGQRDGAREIGADRATDRDREVPGSLEVQVVDNAIV